MINRLFDYLQYPFVRYAIIVSVLVALSSSLLGVTLVLKRFSFIGDGLSHVAFGAVAIASVLKISNKMSLALPITIICAVLLLRTGQKANISGDVCTTLFGSTSILTLTPREVILSTVLSIMVVLIFIIFYNKIFAVTFDESFAKAAGTKADAYNLLVAVVIAVIIVLAMNLVGSLLISALVIFPALSAMRIFKSFKSVTIFSAIFSVICALLGLIISILAGTPVGSTIVAIDVAAFLVCCIMGKIVKSS